MTHERGRQRKTVVGQEKREPQRYRSRREPDGASPRSREDDKQLGERAVELMRQLEKLDSPRLRRREDGAMVPVGDTVTWFEGLVASTGSTNPHLQEALMRGATFAMGCAEDEGEKKKPYHERANLALALMHAIHPTTPLEGLLATQMAVAHAMSVRAADYACWSQDTDVKRTWAGLSAKFMATFTQQIDALEKLRGRTGTQTVRVEHVTVQAGGQAIVGAVSPRGEGGWNGNERNDPMHRGAAPQRAENVVGVPAERSPSADDLAVACTAVGHRARRRGTRTR